MAPLTFAEGRVRDTGCPDAVATTATTVVMERQSPMRTNTGATHKMLKTNRTRNRTMVTKLPPIEHRTTRDHAGEACNALKWTMGTKQTTYADEHYASTRPNKMEKRKPATVEQDDDHYAANVCR